ncbi:copper resistance protein CopB (plasmid) [[Limnothrix rosea] IAM M-220]|nr:copper resistance protein CopB [[Limnothrix rosea] IAM M-220]
MVGGFGVWETNPAIAQYQDHNMLMTEENNNNSSSESNQDIDYVIEEIPDEWGEPINDSQSFSVLIFDQLEYRVNDGEDSFNWDVIGWKGGDYQRIWLKTEGDVGLDTGAGEAEIQLLYGKLIAPFWDFQAGLRYDQEYGEAENAGRAFAVVGVQGLSPYLFEVDAALFLSDEGDVSARLSAEQQLLITQKLSLQPEIEMNIAAQKVEEFGVGSGINDIELGLRLRYEINRNFAPYVGITWGTKLFETADLARSEGKEVSDFSVVGGVKLLF